MRIAGQRRGQSHGGTCTFRARRQADESSEKRLVHAHSVEMVHCKLVCVVYVVHVDVFGTWSLFCSMLIKFSRMVVHSVIKFMNYF